MRSQSNFKLVLVFRVSLLCILPTVSFQSSAGESNAIYGVVGLGSSTASFSRGDLGPIKFASKYSADTRDLAAALLLGYEINGDWSIETGYYSLGHFRQRVEATSGVLYQGIVYEIDYRAKTSVLALKYQSSIGANLWVFGRAGLARSSLQKQLRVDVSQHIEPPVAPCLPSEGECLPVFSGSQLFSGLETVRRSSNRAMLGVGLEWTFSPRFRGRLSFDDFGRIGDSRVTGRARMRAGTVMLQASF